MYRFFVAVTGTVLVATTVSAAPQTWTGTISDSMCGAKHMSMGNKKMTDRECTEACVKANAKYVLVVGGKVYQIADQKAPALATHAGHRVTVTGESNGDAISATKIEMAPDEKR